MLPGVECVGGGGCPRCPWCCEAIRPPPTPPQLLGRCSTHRTLLPLLVLGDKKQRHRHVCLRAPPEGKLLYHSTKSAWESPAIPLPFVKLTWLLDSVLQPMAGKLQREERQVKARQKALESSARPLIQERGGGKGGGAEYKGKRGVGLNLECLEW